MGLFFLVFFLIIGALAIFVYFAGHGEISINSADFVAKGKEAGLTGPQIKMLKKTSDILKLEKPLTLLGTVDNIDSAVLGLNKLLKESNYQNLEIIDLLEELHKYRKKIELEKIEKRNNITNTSEIPVNQLVKITIGALETPITGVVTSNDFSFLTIELKKETKIRPGINWKEPVNIYFWKKDDAGYFFEGVVDNTPTSRTWNIQHTNNLIRSQKREDLRVNVEINCYLYRLEDISRINSNPEGFTGIFSQIKNISEGGAALLVNGLFPVGSIVKMEFKIKEEIIVLCAIVKFSKLNSANNISYLRLKTIEPGIEMLSILRPFIFLKSRELYQRKSNKNHKAVENKPEINNNDSMEERDSEEEPEEVEYLPEKDGVLN